MTAQIVGPNAFSIGLVIGLVTLSMIAGVIDLFRKPGWAWRAAQESRIAYLVLILLLPLVGLGMYLYGARPKVVAKASAGRAASLPFERFGEDSVQKQREDGRPLGTITAPAALGSFGEIRGEGPYPFGGDAASLPVGGSFLQTEGNATLRSPVGLSRAYRPRPTRRRPRRRAGGTVRPDRHREHDHDRPVRLESRPDRPPRVPVLGRRALDRERRRRRAPGPRRRVRLIAESAAPAPFPTLPAGPSVPPVSVPGGPAG